MISSDKRYKTEEVLAPTEHNVQFYENDDFLADQISAFLRVEDERYGVAPEGAKPS